MPTTPNGTAYTVTSASVSGAGTVRWGVADTETADIPAILYCHGSGGANNQFETLSAWTDFRNWIIDNGWAWIEGSGGGTTSWGNAAARTAYENAYTHVAGVLDLGGIVPFGRSMGGVVASWLFTESTVVAPVSIGCVINSGVQDLLAFYDGTSTTVQGQMLTAFAATDRADFITKTAGYEPLDRAASLWSGKKVIQLVGDADTTVPPAAHGYAMRTHYAGQPAIDRLDVRVGGDHSAGNGSYLQTTAMADFLAYDVLGLTPPPPVVTNYYELVEAFYVGPGGALYPLAGVWD